MLCPWDGMCKFLPLAKWRNLLHWWCRFPSKMLWWPQWFLEMWSSKTFLQCSRHGALPGGCVPLQWDKGRDPSQQMDIFKRLTAADWGERHFTASDSHTRNKWPDYLPDSRTFVLLKMKKCARRTFSSYKLVQIKLLQASMLIWAATLPANVGCRLHESSPWNHFFGGSLQWQFYIWVMVKILYVESPCQTIM